MASRGPGQTLGRMGSLGATGQPPSGTSRIAPHGMAVVSTATQQTQLQLQQFQQQQAALQQQQQFQAQQSTMQQQFPAVVQQQAQQQHLIKLHHQNQQQESYQLTKDKRTLFRRQGRVLHPTWPRVHLPKPDTAPPTGEDWSAVQEAL
ncbi:uncharacterized protein PS065_018331 [Dugong dugon]